jgi:Arylsulfotransferase (ASST)
MSPRRLLLVALAVAAAIAAVVVLATGAISGGGKSTAHVASSPSCLPTTLNHSAKLAGLPVDVSPAPQTDTANPHTQISFLGVPADAIRDVSVVGQRSGRHSGRLEAYSQGDGASFVPNTPFQAGERVTVSATIDAGPSPALDAGGSPATGASGTPALDTGPSSTSGGAGRRISFGFSVDTPYPTAGAGEFPNPAASPSEYESFRTLPGVQAPTLTVTTPDRDPAAGDIFTSNGPGPGRYGALIYTPRGRLVWFDQLPRGVAAEDVNVQSYEGRSDLTLWQGKVLSLGFGQGEDLVLDSSYRPVARIAGGNGLRADLHEFQLAPHGIAYITAYNPIRCDLSSAEGGPRDGAIVDTAIQEIDIKTGLVRWEWHSLDHVAVSESETSPPKRSPWDWFHLNSIDVEGGSAGQSGDLFISARNTWAGYQIEGGSGNILWRLGGEKSSFRIGPGANTAYQHDGRVLPDGEVTFFDDGSNPRVQPQSRGVRIALDFKSHTARLSASYTHPTPLSAASQGNMQTLPDGNVLVGFGGVPQISEFSPGGALLLDAHMPFDMIFYRAYRHPWSARPATPPAALANLNNTGEETIVRMSWNGATGVSRWRVLAGDRPRSLSARITVPASGFESAAILTKKYAYAAVQALGASGQTLGGSPATKVIGYSASLAGGEA